MLPKFSDFSFHLLRLCVCYALCLVCVGVVTKLRQSFSGSKITMIHLQMKHQQVLSEVVTSV
jgi:hypothetical protein